MLRKLVSIVVVLAALMVFASPAMAQSNYAGNYYVDTTYTGTEAGTQTQPFNTIEEAVAAAQNNPNGGNIFTRASATSPYVFFGFVATTVPPDTGMPISTPALFALLGLVALGLVVGGWFLMRRSRTLAHPA
jgi:hypothetical protein